MVDLPLPPPLQGIVLAYCAPVPWEKELRVRAAVTTYRWHTRGWPWCEIGIRVLWLRQSIQFGVLLAWTTLLWHCWHKTKG